MSPIINYLNSNSHNCLFYANDITIFFLNKHLDLALYSFHNILSNYFFSVAPEKARHLSLKYNDRIIA